MRILLLRDWLGPMKDGSGLRQCRAGETVSVPHANGSKLLRRHVAKWVAYDEGDPAWPDGLPPIPFRAAQPAVDKMIHRAVNK